MGTYFIQTIDVTYKLHLNCVQAYLFSTTVLLPLLVKQIWNSPKITHYLATTRLDLRHLMDGIPEQLYKHRLRLHDLSM